MKAENIDEKWMRRAIANARLGEGLTRPNPPVGAVLVRDGELLGEGYHHRAGLEHAEVNALAACRADPRGATAYVTLEPCSTHGRQPPCTEALLKAGIARVVVSALDVNPKHAGRGLELLRQNGVEVCENVCAEEGLELLAGFNKYMLRSMPYLTLKLAMTLDGCIADRKGESKWITGAGARARVQELRRRSDAVLIGGGTAAADDPSLLYRGRFEGAEEAGSKLLRVVIDTKASLSGNLKIFSDEAVDRTLLVRYEDVPEVTPVAPGVECWRFPRPAEGCFPYRRLLAKLAAEKSCLRVLCEGGGGVAMGLAGQGLVDEYALFFAPALLGDVAGKRGFSGGERLLGQKLKLRFAEVEQIEGELLIRAFPEASE